MVGALNQVFDELEDRFIKRLFTLLVIDGLKRGIEP